VLADITSGKYFGEIAFTAMVKKLLQVRKKKDLLIFLVRIMYLPPPLALALSVIINNLITSSTALTFLSLFIL
jgi:hypothetical protein